MSTSLNKKPEWDYYPSIWKTEAEYLSWLRGQFRMIWRDSPQRALFLKDKRMKVPVLDANGLPVMVKKTGKPKMVNGFQCEYCETYMKESGKVPGTKFKPLYAVDHKIGGHSLKSFNDIGSFVTAIISVRPQDLQILCHICHDIKTHSEKVGLSFELAAYDKIAIKLLKDKEDKQFFIDRSLPVPSNAEKRRAEIVKILEQENNKNKDDK
jgi:hypothetical protein